MTAEDKAFSDLNDKEETVQFVFKSEKENTVTSYKWKSKAKMTKPRNSSKADFQPVLPQWKTVFVLMCYQLSTIKVSTSGWEYK